jgi:hypothetical protein
MKKIATLIIALISASSFYAQNAELIVQKIDNGDVVPGETYRIYAQLTDATASLHAVFGDSNGSMIIQSTADFYQHDFGGQTSALVNEAAIAADPALAYDSWVSIGADNANSNNLWDVGIDFLNFKNGSELFIEDGAWFLVPTDAYTMPDQSGLILLAQLTTAGTATGSINMQGWVGDKEAWQERNVEFTTTNAHTFGCTNGDAENFNPEATFDDGTCEIEEGGSDITPVALRPEMDSNDWQVFPNPIWENQFNIQFSQVIDLEAGKLVINIYEMSGKLAHSEQINAENIIGGNKITISTELASGMYNVNLVQGEMNESQQIVVQK